MTETKQPLALVACRLPADTVAQLRRNARNDDRRLSAYLRRLLVAAASASKEKDDASGR